MTLRPFALILAALALMLGACSQPKQAKQSGTAQGEILEGSVSDAMLPLDTVRSQAPLASGPASSDGPATGAATKAAAPRAITPRAAKPGAVPKAAASAKAAPKTQPSPAEPT